MKISVADSALGHDQVGERLDLRDAASKDGYFEAIIVVEVNVQGRDGQFVMIVLLGGEPLRQLARLMLVDVGQRTDARLLRLDPRRLRGLGFAHEVPDGLGPAGIAPLPTQSVEGGEEIVVDGDGDALHDSRPSFRRG